MYSDLQKRPAREKSFKRNNDKEKGTTDPWIKR